MLPWIEGPPWWLSSKAFANARDIRDMGLTLGWEDLLEEGMATHSNILGWKIPWTEEPGGLQSMGSQKSQTGPSN